MATTRIKQVRYEEQDGFCGLTQMSLPFDLSLSDMHILDPDREFVKDNIDIVDVKAHLIEHNIYREREESLQHLKNLIRERSQIQKLLDKVNNQLLAMKRLPEIKLIEANQFLEENVKQIKHQVSKYDWRVEKAVRDLASKDNLVAAALGVKGAGVITVAHCAVYIDLEKAPHASSLWKYVGLHTPSYSRYKKGQSGGGNKTLRSILYNFAAAQIRLYGPYRYLYDDIKERWSKSTDLTMTRVKGSSTPIQKRKCDVSAGHKDGVGRRRMIKHFLADYWYVGRTLLGLPTSPIYAEAILKGNHRTVLPEERGWIY